MAGAKGFSLASRRAVALLGLGTASRSRVLARYRSGVRIPHASEAVHSLVYPPYKNPSLRWSILYGGCEGIRTLDLLRDRETC